MGIIAGTPFDFGRDGIVRYETLDRLMRFGICDSNRYSLYGPLAASPLWFLGERIGLAREAVWTFNRIAFLTAVVGLWWALRRSLDECERVRFALLLLFGGMFPWHVSFFFAEVAYCAGAGLGLALVAEGRGWFAWLGCGLAIWATANVPATIIGLGLAVSVLCWERRRLRYLLLPFASAALIVLENWLRRGDPLDAGYRGDSGFRTLMPYSGVAGFSYPLALGLLATLFSFGKGLIFFTPGLFARYPKSDPTSNPLSTDDSRLLYRMWMAVAIGLLLVYPRWWAWYGGTVWGPRFYLFACLPASLVLARWSGRAERLALGGNLLLLAALALSCWVGANGSVYRDFGSQLLYEDDFAQEHLEWFVPEYSVLWRPFVFHRPLIWTDLGRLAAFAGAFAYLAWPVAGMLASQTVRLSYEAWLRARSGPRWRF
jgi:hypothetical protein